MDALSDETLTALRPLAQRFPTLDAVLGEIARISGELTLPRGGVHILSDIHGDDVKLRHVINNASGLLRPLVKRVFGERLDPAGLQELLSLLFYPRETLAMLEPTLRDPAARQAFCRRTLSDLFVLVNVLARRYPERRARTAFPPDYRDLFAELLRAPSNERGPRYYDALIDPLIRHDRALQVMGLTVRVIRNLAVEELVIGGDLWDRGPRGDRVVDCLMREPNVAFIWGNHDTAWLGAALGCEALIAHVCRISLRYGRLAQLEEGYGIPLEPLERLARTVYHDDPALRFFPKNAGSRDPLLSARMQKAAAMMQFKLEGKLITNYPDWNLADRRLLHTICDGTVEIAGRRYPLTDTRFPTLNLADAYALSPEEQDCLNALKKQFINSPRLQTQMIYLLRHGSMYVVRDDHLIFHGCVPTDDAGRFLPMEIDGQIVAGKALFDALNVVFARLLDKTTEMLTETAPDVRANDRDLMWYLWCGPNSPLFGKDKIATFENDFVDDHDIRQETKNPYFSLIHEVAFCDSVLCAFGADPQRGLIVNGHVPVKIEKGESPMKRSGKAITIDGAFSQAYGDHGYTLMLEPERTLLATHHHFKSVEAAVREGQDIIPTMSVIRSHDPPRTVGDTERGTELRREVQWLERLAQAYRLNWIR